MPLPIPRLEPPTTDSPGLDEGSRALYARLAAAGPTPIDELDATTVQALQAVGLLVVTAGLVDIVPPTGPLLEVANQHAQHAIAAHNAIDDLTALWRSARGQEVGVEMLSGAAAGREYSMRLGGAQREVLSLSIGPRSGKSAEAAPGALELLARGVSVQVIYHSRVFENDAALFVASQCIAAGEQARVSSRVPVNMLIIDDFAMMNVSYDSDEPMHLACVRNHRVVESWRAIFHAFWQLAMPLDPASALTPGQSPASEEHRELVRLLSLGITDRAIAAELGVSERTVGRRVTALQERLGVDTRFQLGLQLAAQGWV